MKNDSEHPYFGPPADGLDAPTERHIPPADGLDSPTEHYVPLPPTEKMSFSTGNYHGEASSAFPDLAPPQATSQPQHTTTHFSPQELPPSPIPPVPPVYTPHIPNLTNSIPAPAVLAPPVATPPKKNQGSSIAIIITLVVLSLCAIAATIGIWYMATHDTETDQNSSTVHSNVSKSRKNSSNSSEEQETHKDNEHKSEDDSADKQEPQNQAQPSPSIPAQPSLPTPAPSYIDARGYVMSVFNGSKLAVSPSCNGDAILIHNSVVEQPGVDTGSAIEAALNAAPAGAVFTTPGACSSLRAQLNGANIYAVYTNYGSNVNAMCSAYALYGGIPRTLNSAGDFTNPCGY